MLFRLIFSVAATAILTEANDCRCTPYEDCWPSNQQWQALNTSIQGNLLGVRPVAAVCHDPNFDPASCQEVTAEWTNSSWRAAQPGAVQWENWEAWLEQNQSCYIENSRQEPCGQGRISLYSAVVQNEAHIQQAVRFAGQHNLRLAVKSSGHDYSGRSSSPYSLQILTNRLKNIKFVDNFVPDGSEEDQAEGPAVIIGSGVSLQEIYAAASGRGLVVIGGTAHTVGIAGGYIQGGGHSILGPWKGMGSDQALEFRVVVANGDLLTANKYQNQDLFWALRGGGGGTFGVVVSVTVHTFPDVPLVMSNLNVSADAGPNFWPAVTAFHTHLPAFNDAGGGGYYFITASPPINNGESTLALTVEFYFANETDTTKINTLFAPLVSILKNMAGIATEYGTIAVPHVADVYQTLLPGDSDTTGSITLGGSRLFSRDLLVSDGGGARLIDAVSRLRLDPEEEMIGIVVAGGAVAANGETVDSSLNPAWRRTIIHFIFERTFSPNATLAEQNAVRDNVTNVEVPLLRAVEGPDSHMGAYLNEANPYETDFQSSFWGENYPRLYHIKQQWDPQGLFIVRRGVGSEDWDDEGLCRTSYET
ncbi:hypothetical protein V8E54_013910 [Elaphomyces granulatus]